MRRLERASRKGEVPLGRSTCEVTLRGIQARIERESFLECELAASRCASRIEEKVPAFVGDAAGY
jgi:hypothetical protein